MKSVNAYLCPLHIHNEVPSGREKLRPPVLGCQLVSPKSMAIVHQNNIACDTDSQMSMYLLHRKWKHLLTRQRYTPRSMSDVLSIVSSRRLFRTEWLCTHSKTMLWKMNARMNVQLTTVQNCSEELSRAIGHQWMRKFLNIISFTNFLDFSWVNLEKNIEVGRNGRCSDLPLSTYK